MKKVRYLLTFVMFLVLLFISVNTKVYAYEYLSLPLTPWHSDTSKSLYRYKGKDGVWDRSKWKYRLKNDSTTLVAFCVEPGVDYSGNVGYTNSSSNFSLSSEVKKKVSYIASQTDIDGEVRQSAIWCIVYPSGTLEASDGDGDLDEVNDLVDKVNKLYKDGEIIVGEGGSKASMGKTLTFDYDSTRDAYVSNKHKVTVTGTAKLTLTAPTGSYIYYDNSSQGTKATLTETKTIQIVIPRTSFSGVYNVSLNAKAEAGTAVVYEECDIYKAGNDGTVKASDGYSQYLATPNSRTDTSGGSDVTATGTVERELGNLRVAKEDTYGRLRPGAHFVVTGPYGFREEFDSTSSFKEFKNIDVGEYSVTETTAPINMIINVEPVKDTVIANQTVTIKLKNPYQRGSVSLTKYDADHRGNTLGDATIQGAKFTLYAAEQIKEGEVVVYNANQVVKNNIVTKADGTTDAVPNLPIGNYYYLEDEPSEGFNINNNKIPVSIAYAGQNSSVAVSGANEAPESPIYGGLKIYKVLGATDYDPEINLEGVQFKLTLKKDSNQVYYSNVSGSDGVCEFSHIPYGKYTLSECVTPASAYTVADREVFIKTNGEVIPLNIEDPSKMMKIEVYKEILLREGEATDAKISGAVFTLYLDEACTKKYVDKDGNVVTIGPTNDDGYAISKKMRTGTYYLKETTFPEGIDPDAVIPNENVTYRNKVYTASYDNRTQGTDVVTVTQRVKNEPVRNHLEIIKHVGETSNTSQFPLDKCEFTATLISSKGTDHVFSRKCTAETTRDTGYCIIEDLPYGTYEVEETKVSPITLKCDIFTFKVGEDKKVKTVPYKPKDGTFETTILNQHPQTSWLDLEGNLVDIPKVMIIKMHKVDTDRTDADSKTYMQGDAKLQGAVYEIYRYDPETDDYTEYVYDITIDHLDDGYWTATSGELAVGKYKVIEKVKYSETIDGTKYDYSYAEGYLTDPKPYYFDQNPEAQTVRLTTHVKTSNDTVARGRVQVVKYDNDRSNVDAENDSDKVPSAGAILRLTLDSNPDIYYTVKLDDKGYGEFIETNDATHTSTAAHDSKPTYYPYTIPYGKYTITEDKEADGGENTSFYVQPEAVEIPRQAEKQYRIEADEPVPAYLKLTKKDATTSEIVGLPNASFKIYSITEDRWVTMKAGVGIEIDEFSTNDEGYLYTPQKLNPGEYLVYETKAPDGYFLQKELRVPDVKADLGKIEKGGKKVSLNKVATGLTADAINPGKVATGDLEYGVDLADTPLYVNIKIIKTAEMITGSTTSTVTYNSTNGETVDLEKHSAKYTPGIGLEGVSYKIYADEDIYTPDGQFRTAKDTLVDDVTTNSEGIAQSRKDLFPGRYRVVEYKVPTGYLLDTTPKYIKAENENQYVESATATLELSDVRQKLGYKFKKIFEQYKYATGQEAKYAVFGIYNKDDIKTYNGNIAIAANTLVDVLIANGEGYVESPDLPEGKYYVKELYVAYPYALSNKTVDFELKYNGDGVTPTITVEGEEVVNTPDTGYARFIKLSKSNDDGLVVNGSDLLAEGLDQKAAKILEYVQNMTDDEMEAYFEEEGILFVPGAEYEIWLDEEGTNKLLEVNLDTGDMKVATFTTDNVGVLKIFEIPKGAYFLKETKAPQGYKVQNDVVPFYITASSPEATIFQAIYDESVLGPGLHKTDIYTGENVPNCKFEIRDENGELLLYAITDEEGMAYIPEDMFENGKTYTYTELEAPDVYKDDGKLYVLNTEPHEFVAKFDEEGNWITEKVEVENYRPTTNVKFVKTDEEDNLVPNCKFELKSEEEGLYYKTGVTDENGIYVFENVPQGWYTYTELEAPEEYDLDTTPHRIYVTGDEMIIEFVNTGDIPVVAITIVALVSVAGIAYITTKKLRMSKEKLI